MCGIAGIIDFGAGFGRERLREIVIAMRETMVHRGPDDAGVWVDDAGMCALAHRRLSIIDLTAEGRQPMDNEDGSVLVTFNGEIYNYQEIRTELESRGHRFHSRTDTEILPRLFESMDSDRLRDLDGMFGMGLWHQKKRRLLLARDPFGKKPLYYGQGPGWFAFASELHALTCVPGFDFAIDRDGLALYLLLQYVPSPWTIYGGARKLPPGAYLEADFSNGWSEPNVACFSAFRAQEPSALRKKPLALQAEELKPLIIEGVRKRLVSDVPLGAFLSGGVDSSLVVAMITKELGQSINTFSIGFEGTQDTEHVYARTVAEHLGAEHHEEIVKPDAVNMVTKIASVLDEPNGDSSCLPTLLLCQHARRFVTVALSGDGGDEMFGGYGRYRDTLVESGNWRRRLLESVRKHRWYTPADGYLSPRWLMFQPAQVSAMMGGLSPSVESQLDGWRRQLNDITRPLLHRMRNLDVEMYLPGAVLAKVDRMSMQVALEVRCPLLDREVARYAQGVAAASCWQPPHETKKILKHLLMQYLPAELVDRKKMGFGLPANAWSHDAMLSLTNDLLLAPSSRLADLLQRKMLHEWVKQQSTPGWFSIYQVWPMLILELWLRKSSSQTRVTRQNASNALGRMDCAAVN
ncbi:MAG: asparagine synthase (glutamine-hydrolyzing) [Gammaproteobacteria bacterium]